MADAPGEELVLTTRRSPQCRQDHEALAASRLLGRYAGGCGTLG